MKAYLYLEDGTVFCGTHAGAKKETISEMVFNTSMAGYPEVLTDPSYAGQAVCMTYPLIGNYGVIREDMESKRIWMDGFIVRELSLKPSNFRSDITIQDFLLKYDIPCICGIDTRALTKRLRTNGTMNGCISTVKYEGAALEELLKKIREYSVKGVVRKVTCREKYVVKGSKTLSDNGPIAGSSVYTGSHEKRPSYVYDLSAEGLKIALLDLGLKENIVRSLAMRGADVTVYPAYTPASEILADAPDGIMLSNGPGDPKDCPEIIEELKKIYASDVPVFAICLGHQLMALASGADTHKMHYGHRGGNHPVKDLETGRVYISSQNHGYVVDTDGLDPKIAVPAFVNVNDGTNEGLKYTGKNIFTVQFHPESCPGPGDTAYLFDRFAEMIKGGKHNA